MVRCVLGRRGDFTQRLRSEAGANIHVLAVLRTLMNWSRSLESQLWQRGLFMKYLLYCIRICARTNLQVFQGLWNPRSRTIEAILQLQNKTSEFSGKGMITRLLVLSSKVGCILGQGGQDINEMRRLRAEICVYPKNEWPKCASEDEELVQISGYCI